MKGMKKRIVVLALAVVVILAFSVGCGTNNAPAGSAGASTPAATGSSPASGGSSAAASGGSAAAASNYSPKDHPIGMCIWLKVHPVVQLMIAGFMSEAKKLGYDQHLFAPDEADAQKTYGLLEAGIAQFKVQGIAIQILDESTAQYIKKMADQGIVVVTGHTYISDADKATYPGLVAFAACSAIDYGTTAAKAIGDKCGGKGTVAITVGSFNPTENAAAAAFAAEIKKDYPNMKVLDPIEEGFDTPTAIQRATAIVQGNPDLVAAFSTTGAGPSTWAGAKKNTGKDITIISMDYARANLDLVKSGEVYGLVAQPLVQEWAMCADLLDKKLRGGEIQFANVMDAPLITKDNVADYYSLIDQAEADFKAINSN